MPNSFFIANPFWQESDFPSMVLHVERDLKLISWIVVDSCRANEKIDVEMPQIEAFRHFEGLLSVFNF